MGKIAYRLGGMVDGVERTFDLGARVQRVGRSLASDVALPVIGVSRQHAVLRLTSAGLEVEDLGSRNGTFVDEERVLRAAVPAGAELRFGPVGLRLEAVDADDLEIALAFGPSALPEEPKITAPWPDDEEATLAQSDFKTAVSRAWWTLLENFIERLKIGSQAHLAGALAFLIETLGAVGVCAVDWTPAAGPLVLATAGELPELPPLTEIRRLQADCESSGTEVCAAFWETEPVLSVAAHFGRPQEPRCLLLWGEFPARLKSAALLRALIRLVNLQEPRIATPPPPGPGAPEDLPELIFPKDYRPGTSPAAAAMYRQLRQLLKGHLAVLIAGETGVGKERVAKILHASSERREGPFVAINCAAIPAEMLEAEMFGIGKGVATGVAERPGKFQLAEGGTLFLDEIGEMAPALQAKLLRALQEREIQPVGGPPCRVDARVLAATNADLVQCMDDGAFRRDLYYRLAGHQVEVPPLRRSKDEIAGLVEHFLRRFSRQTGTHLRGVTAKALRLLSNYPWPGNVRELEHEMHRLVCSSADGQVIDSEQLAHRIRHPPWSEPEAGPESSDEPLALAPRLRELEVRMVREALRRSGGKQVAAAKLLKISRNGLAKKMKRFAIRG